MLQHSSNVVLYTNQHNPKNKTGKKINAQKEILHCVLDDNIHETVILSVAKNLFTFIVYAFDNTCLSQPTRATPSALLRVTYCCKYCRTLGFIKPRL